MGKSAVIFTKFKKNMLTIGVALSVLLMSLSSVAAPPWKRAGTVSTDWGQIHYRTAGKGEPLLLLHGYLGHGGQWEKYLDKFPGHKLIAPDLLDHGRSSSNADTFSVEANARAIWALLDILGIHHIRGIGYSAGGMTLLHMALLQPDRVESVILAASALRVPLRDAGQEFDQLPLGFQADLLRNHLGNRERINKLLSMRYESTMKTAQLSELHVPVLMVVGDRDESFPPEAILETYSGLPNAQLWMLPGMGHSLFWPEWGGSRELETAFPEKCTDFLPLGCALSYVFLFGIRDGQASDQDTGRGPAGATKTRAIRRNPAIGARIFRVIRYGLPNLNTKNPCTPGVR